MIEIFFNRINFFNNLHNNISITLIRDLIRIKSAVKFYSFHHQVKKEKILLIPLMNPINPTDTGCCNDLINLDIDWCKLRIN